MTRFLKPGFHSGTVPKRFAKLRRAERRIRAGGSWNAVRKQLLALEHVEEAIRRYVDREFLELLSHGRGWQTQPVLLRRVYLSTNSVKLTLGCPGIGPDDLQIALEMESGRLTAELIGSKWMDRLSSDQREAMRIALVGLYHSAGVELVRCNEEVQFLPTMPWPQWVAIWEALC
jgi:hypothetical protein